MPENIDIPSNWSEVYFKIVSEFHPLPINRAIREKRITNIETEHYTAEIKCSEPDLENYCTKSEDNSKCQKTLKAITFQMNAIVKFNRKVCRKSKDLRSRISSDLMIVLTSACNSAFRVPPTVYGSFENELCCYESNMNLHVEYHHPNCNDLWKQIKKKVEEKYRSRFFFDKRLEVDASNTELLLRMVHKVTSVETVVSFTNPMRLNNSMLMNIYLNLNSNLKPLVIYLKHILVLHDLHGDDKISTYLLFWLSVYYCQRQGLLPTVKDIRSIVSVPKCYIGNRWNCSVPPPESITFKSNNPTDKSAPYLFLGFVQFYNSFDFLRYVISPYVGHSILLEYFDTYIMPMDAEDTEKLSGVFEKISFVKSAANFQDPTILDRNLFSPVPIKVINSFKHLCKYLHGYYYKTLLEENDFHINLPIVLPDPAPINLIQYTSITLDLTDLLTSSRDLNDNVIVGIRLLMEDVLKFTLTRMTVKTERKIKSLVNVVYFDYRVNSENCNDVVLLIVNRITKLASGTVTNFLPQRIKNEMFRIYIVCEIFTPRNVKLLIEGTACFIDFFSVLGSTLLYYVIKHVSQN